MDITPNRDKPKQNLRQLAVSNGEIHSFNFIHLCC